MYDWEQAPWPTSLSGDERDLIMMEVGSQWGARPLTEVMRAGRAGPVPYHTLTRSQTWRPGQLSARLSYLQCVRTGDTIVLRSMRSSWNPTGGTGNDLHDQLRILDDNTKWPPVEWLAVAGVRGLQAFDVQEGQGLRGAV